MISGLTSPSRRLVYEGALSEIQYIRGINPALKGALRVIEGDALASRETRERLDVDT